jgi:hypothetical protein
MKTMTRYTQGKQYPAAQEKPVGQSEGWTPAAPKTTQPVSKTEWTPAPPKG